MSKSIWKRNQKFHIPAASLVLPEKPKNFIAWRERSDKQGWVATCLGCKRKKRITHPTQKHLVSSETGLCYTCRSRQKPAQHVPSTTEQTVRGYVEPPQEGHVLHRRTVQSSNHSGHLVNEPAEAAYTAAALIYAIKAKVHYPHWSCCLEPASTKLCPKRRRRKEHQQANVRSSLMDKATSIS